MVVLEMAEEPGSNCGAASVSDAARAEPRVACCATDTGEEEAESCCKESGGC